MKILKSTVQEMILKKKKNEKKLSIASLITEKSKRIINKNFQIIGKNNDFFCSRISKKI